ncbi:MAG: 2-amino-4-hydroxy-6-hydroxymethyldihydropteridine diphosphokinase [Bacteroidales bacterium]|nr:2-amino-4-hydroxy-6-hydroxymethyldihydropteridine diphosphokinase [Bacteroidales bacterium]
MSVVYLSLGSNLGDREHFIDCAICEIDKRIGEVTNISSKYETEPWGFISKNKFINVAVEVKTQLSASEVSVIVHKIEDELGRKRDINSTGYEDRVIDIDILLFDDIISNDELLTLPHPKMHLREFVIVPLREIAPEIIHPVLGMAIKNIKL